MEKSNSTILIVDDDINLVDKLSSAFVSIGYEVFTAYNGESGLKTAKSIRPGLIIIDISMPIMDGISMLKDIRQDPLIGNSNVIIVSALSNEILLKYSLEFSAQEYLNKNNKSQEDIIKIAKKYLS